MRSSTESRAGLLKPAFVQIDEFKHRLHRAGWQADLREALVQSLRTGIAPAAFGHERIPHLDLLLARLPAMCECPLEQLLIPAALERFRLERRVIDVEEPTAARVKTPLHGRAPARLPALGQFPRRREPDFIQHATEINDALDLIERAPQSGNGRWVWKCHALSKANPLPIRKPAVRLPRSATKPCPSSERHFHLHEEQLGFADEAGVSENVFGEEVTIGARGHDDHVLGPSIDRDEGGAGGRARHCPEAGAVCILGGEPAPVCEAGRVGAQATDQPDAGALASGGDGLVGPFASETNFE